MSQQSGDHWIFLRGLARSKAHWGNFQEYFQKQFPNDHIHFLDTAGNGTEIHRLSFTSIQENVTDLRSRAIRDGILTEDRQINLVAISLGGMIAAEWAHQYPEDISKLFFINTSDRRTSSFYQRLLPSNYIKILQLLIQSDSSQDLEYQILNMTTNLLSVDQKQKWAIEFANINICSKHNFLRQLWAAARYQFPREKPRIPTLFLASQSDRLVSYVCSEKISTRWRCPLTLHPSAGHDLPLDDSEWVVRQLLKL